MPFYAVSLKSFRREARKPGNDRPVPGREQFFRAHRTRDVWIDASFFDPKNSRTPPGTIWAGGAAVIGNEDRVHSIMITDMNQHNVTTSDKAELLNAIITLEQMPYGQVRRLSTDATRVFNPMSIILKKGAEAETGLNGHHARLVDAMSRHPNLEVCLVNRNREHIPIAHAFAQCAARGDDDRLEIEISTRFEERPELFYTKTGAEAAL